MKSIKTMVEEALLDNIGQDDIEQAVGNIVEEMDIVELLSDSDEMKDAVYAAVNRVLDDVLQAYL